MLQVKENDRTLKVEMDWIKGNFASFPWKKRIFPFHAMCFKLTNSFITSLTEGIKPLDMS